ncbi:MAG: hypothetical protein ABSA11_16345 [Candidatus Bathyarchaeia archaeon]|jgi:hypothetical protein
MSATLTFIRINLAKLLLLIGGISALLTWYFTTPEFGTVFNTFNTWNIDITLFTLFTGLIVICMRYFRGVREKTPGIWMFELYGLILIFAWIIMGTIYGMYSDTYQTIFLSTKITLHIAILGQLVFFMISGAYRTFRLKSLRTVAFALSAMVIIFMNIPFVQNGWAGANAFSYWLLNNPQTGGARAVVITGGIGAVVLGMRILLGLEKGPSRVTEA